jgi:hypothetical protein
MDSAHRFFSRVALGTLTGLVLLAALLPARAVAQEVADDVVGRRHVNVSLGMPVVVDSEGAYDPSLGVKFTARAGYQIDILVVEGHAGFQQFGARSPVGRGRTNVYGPFIGFGGRLRFEVNETLVPYIMAGLRLSWWGVEGVNELRFAPTLVSQLGMELHLGAANDWMIHMGVDVDVYMPGKAFVDRAFSIGPYVGVGVRL